MKEIITIAEPIASLLNKQEAEDGQTYPSDALRGGTACG